MSRVILTLALAFFCVVSACNCGSNLSCCSQQCYDPAYFSCPTDGVSGNSVLCSLGSQSCNGACYDPTLYNCQSGAIAQGASPATTAAPSSSNGDNCQTMFSQLTCRTSSQDVTKVDPNAVANARSWLCSAYPQYCTDINSGGKYASCNSVQQISYAINLYYGVYQSQGPSACSFGGVGQVFTASTPSTASPTPATSSSSNQCQDMFSTLKCRTASQDPAQVDAASVNNAKNWLCSAYPQYCSDINSGGEYASCNSVQQISYAINLYYNDYESQGSSACSFGGIGFITNPSPTTASPTPTTASSTCQNMWSGLSCRTKSEDPAQLDSNAISSARSWLCSSYGQFCTQINSGGQYSGCNAAEQLSYAMNLYYQAYQSQGSGACDFSGIGSLVNGQSTSGSPVVNPTPSPNQFPTQTADLRLINNCKDTLWFEARYGGEGGPLPGQSTTTSQALPGSYIDFTVPDTGLSGSRFWAKYGCDNYGRNCLIGDQMQYWPNPPGGCPANGCSAPIDSLFEATWGCRPGTSCNSANPTTWFDTSQVDGWTIPYKVTTVGDTSGCDCTASGCGFKGVDASTLDVSKCPTSDNLVGGGQTSVDSYGNTVNLNSVDLRVINNGSILGCMSPCKRINWSAPYGLGQPESYGSGLWMCCPTPYGGDQCTAANGCVTPNECRAGPIVNTQYVNAVHTMAPGVYAYSYDDGVGLHACPAGVTKYTMEFCPSGSAAYPGKV